MRFDKDTSPVYVNAGEGWDQKSAMEWLAEHELDDLIEPPVADDYYIRTKRFDAGKYIDARDMDEGVVVIRCEKKSS